MEIDPKTYFLAFLAAGFFAAFFATFFAAFFVAIVCHLLLADSIDRPESRVLR